MKTYKVTIEFTTDAPAPLIHEIAGDMVAQLETMEDDHDITVEDQTMEVEEVRVDPIVHAIITKQ